MAKRKVEGEPTVDEIAAQVFASFLSNARELELNESVLKSIATRAYTAAEAFVVYRDDKNRHQQGRP